MVLLPAPCNRQRGGWCTTISVPSRVVRKTKRRRHQSTMCHTLVPSKRARVQRVPEPLLQYRRPHRQHVRRDVGIWGECWVRNCFVFVRCLCYTAYTSIYYAMLECHAMLMLCHVYASMLQRRAGVELQTAARLPSCSCTQANSAAGFPYVLCLQKLGFLPAARPPRRRLIAASGLQIHHRSKYVPSASQHYCKIEASQQPQVSVHRSPSALRGAHLFLSPPRTEL